MDVPYFDMGLVVGSTEKSYSYPCSLVQLPDGRLMTTFTMSSAGNCGSAAYSRDCGRNWSEPVVLFGNDCPFDQPLDMPQNFADPTVVVFSDRIVAYCVSLFQKPDSWDLSSTRLWFRASWDSGKTWSAINEQSKHKKYVCGTTNPGLRLSDGSVVLGYSWEENAELGLTIPNGEGDQIYRCGLLRTVDEGKTWHPGGDVQIDVPKGPGALTHAISGADEPAYVQLTDGSIYMLIRTGTSHLWETRSSDAGLSWSKPISSPLISHNCPAALLQLNDGSVLVVYNDHPQVRARLCARVSKDGCRTWSEPKVFAPIGFLEEPQASYPVLCQLPDNMIIVTWGQKRTRNPSDLQKICYARFNLAWICL